MRTLPLLLLAGGALVGSPAAADPNDPPATAPRMHPPLPQLGPRLIPLTAAQVPPPARPAPRRFVAPRPKPPPPAGPAPDVKLAIEAPSPTGPWTLRVRNDGQVPVMLAADGRTLSLDVTPRGERKPFHCELPSDMRPADDMDRSLVLPPGRAYVESVQPRLYCFGDKGLDALAPGAIVVAHLGWGAGARAELRQVVWPLDGIEPVVAALPVLTAPPIALPDEPTPVSLPEVARTLGATEPVSLRVTGTRAVDASTLGSLSVTVTVHNDGSRPVRLRLRPENLAFDVTTSKGSERCAWPVPPTAPMRELFSTLPPQGSESLTVLLAAYCRTRSFDQPGLVVVRPQLDTRRAGGEAIGLRTFNGQIIANSATVVRLHTGTGKVRLARPQLEPQTVPAGPSAPVDPAK